MKCHQQKTTTVEEIEEIEKFLSYMSGGIGDISKLKLLLDMMGQIKELQKQNIKKDKTIALLESRVADLEE